MIINSIDKNNKNSNYKNYYNISRTELDSYINIIVIDKHSVVVEKTRKTVNIKNFSPDCNTMSKVSIVDTVIK